jgi:hypothetical protein
VFSSIPVQKKFGQPFAAPQPIPAETPRRTPTEVQFRQPQQQNRARQQNGRLPVAQEPAVQLIPVENSGFQSAKQQPRLRPIAQQIQEEQPKARPVPQIPLVEEDSFEELEEEEEPELIEAQPQQRPQQPQPLPQQQRPTQPPQPRRPIEGVFSIPQQQDEPQDSAAEPSRDYPRRFETFTPTDSALNKQRNGDDIRVIDKYTMYNDDGSITWGYQSEDGSFKEETNGIDCVTRGR